MAGAAAVAVQCSCSIPGALFNFICQTAVINNRWNDR